MGIARLGGEGVDPCPVVLVLFFYQVIVSKRSIILKAMVFVSFLVIFITIIIKIITIFITEINILIIKINLSLIL